MTNSTSTNQTTLPPIALIPDQTEFEERRADRWVKWLAANDVTSPIKSGEMLEAQFEIDYFQERIAELERQRDYALNRLLDEHRQKTRQQQPLHLQPRPRYQLEQERHRKEAVEAEILMDDRNEDVKLMAGRFNTVIEQAQARVQQAQERFDAAMKEWGDRA